MSLCVSIRCPRCGKAAGAGDPKPFHYQCEVDALTDRFRCARCGEKDHPADVPGCEDCAPGFTSKVAERLADLRRWKAAREAKAGR